MIGMGGHSSNPLEIKIAGEPYLPMKLGFTPSRQRRNKSSVTSQRQLRKNKRRKHAAGFKKAFN
jgi:hypothetical protein